MEIGDSVKVIRTGAHGVVKALEGVPVRKAYVDIEPGAAPGYIYLQMFVNAKDRYIQGEPDGPQTMALNIYSVDDLELIIEESPCINI